MGGPKAARADSKMEAYAGMMIFDPRTP
jgi:hypothetical protein